MEDEEKLRLTQDAFERKIREIETWEDFRTLLQNITKKAIINFIKKNLQQHSQDLRYCANTENANAEEIDDFIIEIDNL